ncbi:hypothetical protein CXB51_019080 [Gossypium anomalum]|uniref:Uncharacterized protein n=1 Tax=Gossypium anomalum TaxID=47600 RepID=A0A8J6CSF1_9ROSI|nr:hypothetical protein CXB51_019080 [Gossypium anomalum]
MDSKMHLQPWWLLPISLLLQLSNLKNWANAAPQVPCYFIFGDSLSDSGNNNNLKTLAKVNYRPYGIDFPKGPTGRFSNGRNVQDAIVELLGFEEYMPPFAKSEKKNILQGVNYASGASGILDETGSLMGARVPMSIQIRNHKTVIARIRKILRNDSSTEKLLRQCIYSIQIGSNDFVNNYFKPNFYNSSHGYRLSEFATMLVRQFAHQIKDLYKTGARIFALIGLGQLGCTPNAIATHGTNGSLCVTKLNDAAFLFNQRLIPLVMALNSKLTDAKFSYLNYSPMKVAQLSLESPCCKTGAGGNRELCIHHSKPCSNRKQYAFWDGVHPTDASNVLIAKNLYGTRSFSDARPFNIQSLARKSSDDLI